MSKDDRTRETPQVESTRLFFEIQSRLERIEELGGKVGLPVLVYAERGNEVFNVMAEELFFAGPDDLKPFLENDQEHRTSTKK